MSWRWDQGRNRYFEFENIQSIAQVLAQLEGASLAAGDADPLRKPLQAGTGLDFAPDHYKVWRNYGRVFQCCLLAAKVDDHLRVTDVCRRLASSGDDRLDMDGYLSVVIPRFAYPYPAFDDYAPQASQVFPFCAVLKLMLFNRPPVDANIGVNEVTGLIIGNHLTGFETQESYAQLTDTGLRYSGDRRRQLREMLKFLSQSSFLKWHDSRLYLDVLPGDIESRRVLEILSHPLPRARHLNPQVEIIGLGSGPEVQHEDVIAVTRKQPADVVFTEGKQLRMTHLRTERSPHIRNALFASLQQPYMCDVCGRNLRMMYPWTDNILEVHHVLPLSAALRLEEANTSLADVVAICSNCHRSIHIYYKQYLNEQARSDFRNKDESRSIYTEAKGLVVQ